MGFSTPFSSSQRSVTQTKKQSSPIFPHAHGAPLVPPVLAWVPVYVLPPFPLSVFQDARHHLSYPVNHHPSHPHDQQHSSSSSQLVPAPNACPQCQRQPKDPHHRFCSVACSQSAARSAPELKPLFAHQHVFLDIAKVFMQSWRSEPGEVRPKVVAVYMITWTESSQTSFEQYRNAIEDRRHFKRRGSFPGNEKKLFRSTRRACNLGEGGNLSLCHDKDCWICETIRYGFEPHLERKRNTPLEAGGIRLGAGIYTTCSSSKADQYAVNIYTPNSSIKAMLVCRVVVGKPYVMYREDPRIRSPPLGYDSVLGETGSSSVFDDDECVVYNEDAIRPAYLVLYDTGRGA